MAKKTVFVVGKIGWEYNDENYYRPESEGVTPVKAYSTKEKAQAACDKLNAPLRKAASLLKKDDDYYFKRQAETNKEEEQADEYGLVPITENYEVIPVEMEE